MGIRGCSKLLQEAEKNNVELLAITDHDTVKAHLELEKLDYSKEEIGVKENRAEFNCVFNNAKNRIIRYNFDVHKMDEWILKYNV